MKIDLLKKTLSTLTALMFSSTMIIGMPTSVFANEIQYGDVDKDSTISSSDALNILQCVVENDELSEDSIIAADVNGDGEIDSSDALNVMQYVVEMINHFDADKTSYESEDIRSFYEICSDTVKNNDAQYGLSILDDSFISKRIIAKSSEKLDITAYNPIETATGVNEDGSYFLMAQFDNVEDTENCLSYLNGLDIIEYAELDEYISGDSDIGTEEDIEAEAIKSWGVKALEADKYAAYVKNTYLNIVKVAVIDTGVSKHNFIGNRLLKGYDFVDNDSDANDQHYHGTHVAGTIVDCTPSLDIQILPVRVLDKNGTGSNINVGNGIRYAADAGADVINLSLGGYGCSKYIDDSIKYANSKGIAVVVAAGNDGNNTSDYCPAHIADCIVVSAVDSNLKKASFSNYGNSIDFAAPGVGINSCIPGGSYKELNGTSMATPHIAAIAAMLKYTDLNMTSKQIVEKLKLCSADLGDSGFDIYYGNGFPKLSKIIPGVTIDKKNFTVEKGKTVKLTATTSPAGQAVTWQTVDSSVATVSSDGTVTGVSKGETFITAAITLNGETIYAESIVTVTETSGLVDSQEYYIVPKCATNLCLTIANNAKTNKSNVCLGTTSAASSVWVAHKSGDYWYFVNKNSGKALDIYGDTIASKSNAQIWTTLKNNTQLFIVKEASTGYFTLTPKANSKINLDVYGDSGWKSGTNVWTYTINNNSTQQFSFKTVK